MDINMETKKISFGFSKITKKSNLLPSKESAKTETVELIKCLEGQKIKLVEEKPEKQPLVIPLKESQKTSAALASLLKRRAVLLGKEEPDENDSIKESETQPKNIEGADDINKRAAKELLAETQGNVFTDRANSLVLPVVKPDDLPLDGAKESTLDDYESIPIQDYGKALLRGMGWIEPPANPNKKAGPPLDDTPMVRPKGMGLGADKFLNKKPLLVAPEANEVLEVKRNAYVRILGGKHKDLYGQIEGFDDHAGRVIIKMAIGGAKEAFNEFLCQPVCKKEYAQYGKCINTSKYEEYKKNENKYGQIMFNKNDKDLIDKNCKDEKKIKKEQIDTKDAYKYSNHRHDYYRDHKNDFKKVNDLEKRYKNASNSNEDRDCRVDNKYRSRNETNIYENRDRKKETKHNKDHRGVCSRDQRIEYQRNTEKDYRRGNERSEVKTYKNYDNKCLEDDNRISLKKYEEQSSSRRNAKDCDTYFNNDRNIQRQRGRDQQKAIDLNDSSDSECEKNKKHKTNKHSKKKSKGTKKSKSKKNSSTDLELSSSSTEFSMDSEDEKYKKYKKQTKKSKRQRERSRSRGKR